MQRRAAALRKLLKPPRAPMVALAKDGTTDHSLRLRWAQSAAATAYELHVTQLSSRLASAKEWTSRSMRAPAERAPPPRRRPRPTASAASASIPASAGGAAGGVATEMVHTLEQLRMDQPYVVSLRARNTLGWGNASAALLVASARGNPPSPRSC